MNDVTCTQCGKTIAPVLPTATYDYSRFCSGFHASATAFISYDNIVAEPTALYAILIEQDMDKIRTIIAEEIENALVARGSKREGNDAHESTTR